MKSSAISTHNRWIRRGNRKYSKKIFKRYKFVCLLMRKELKILSQFILVNQALNLLNLEFLAQIVLKKKIMNLRNPKILLTYSNKKFPHRKKPIN